VIGYPPAPAPWDWYLARYGTDAMAAMADPGPRGTHARTALTRDDPILFAWVYAAHHLTSRDGARSLCAFHVAAATIAAGWTAPRPPPREDRHLLVGPREVGKSTWSFLLLPLWALAHGHRRFVAAFADSGAQAQLHLRSLQQELDTNALLRRDYPTLCAPARRESGTTVADRTDLYLAQSGAVFAAKGLDASSLGLKVRNLRPDLILLDDVEPQGAIYTAYQAEQRQRAITDAVLPMAVDSTVLWAGTTVMAGSLVHQLVRTVTHPEADDTPDWVTAERFRVHYYPALTYADDGSPVSLWPQRWPAADLAAWAGTRSFALNYQNDPEQAGTDLFTRDLLRPRLAPEGYGQTVLWVDPATTTKATSDWTGLAVLSMSPGNRGPVWLRWAGRVRLVGDDLRQHLARLLGTWDDVGAVVVESNQGGDHWHTILAGLPARLRTVHSTVPKDIRIERGLAHLQRDRLVLAADCPPFRDQAIPWPDVAHDDVLDAVCTGADHLLTAAAAVRSRGQAKQARGTEAYA
jgi:hypothetical protein